MEGRFLDGERLTLNQIVTEYLKSGNPLGYLMNKETVRHWLTSLKKRFKNSHHVWFGRLNDLGQYGICVTEAEYKYSLTRYFTFIKGNIQRAVELNQEAQGKGIALSGFKSQSFLLPAPLQVAETKTETKPKKK